MAFLACDVLQIPVEAEMRDEVCVGGYRREQQDGE
jgi:hypothetical protein